MHTAEPFVPVTTTFDVVIGNEKLKRFKSPGNDKVPG
jgi:hypothetical protein